MKRPLVRLWWHGVRVWSDAWAYGALAVLTVVVHLAEVNLVDARAGAWTRAWTGWDYAWHARLEEPFTHAVAAWHAPGVLAAASAYYLGVFLFMLSTVPSLVAADGNARLMRRTLLAYPVLWLLALPGYLLFPATNPYTRLGAESPFDAVHPLLEDLYYILTTRDNTFPSLHVAFTVVLVAQLMRTRWGVVKQTYAVHGALLVASVVFVRVHYVTDVLAGLVVAWAALRIVDACLAPQGALSGVGRALDALCARYSPRRTRGYRAVERWVEPFGDEAG